MGILTRFSDIMKSNINALLDKAEDPAKMVDQTLRNLRENLAEVKKETASVIADEKMAKRRLDECTEGIEKYLKASQAALKAGNEDDARALIAQKQQLEATAASLRQSYDAAKASSKKMKKMYEKLVADISALESRKNAVKTKVSVARAQQAVNKAVMGMNSQSSISSFERMEEKANKMLDSAEAEAELGKDPSSVSDIADKYLNSSSSDVESELEKMKAELGIGE